MKITIGELCQFLESCYPLSLQEAYDNCGLLVGESANYVTNVLISLDITDEVIEEAKQKKCNVIISHHPLIFKGIKNLSKDNFINRALIKCIRSNIALYALHTNLDNHFHGVNAKIIQKLGLINNKILAPKTGNLEKLIVYVPEDSITQVDKAIFSQGGGKIGNYSECHFRSKGTGTFTPNEMAKPSIGNALKREEVSEYRIEYLIPNYVKHKVMAALLSAHPYEEVAYEWVKVENVNQETGSGFIGELKKEISVIEFLKFVKKTFNCQSVKYTKSKQENIKKVAVCGGSGSFLLPTAIKEGADIFISSDFKYHDFFEGENKIVIADIGHFESEQFTCELIAEKLKENFSTFAIQITEINTNPINYL